MIKFFKAALAACVAVVAAAGPASAAVVYLSGSSEDNTAPLNVSAWTLSLDYTPSTGTKAVVNSAVFSVNRAGTQYVWNTLKAPGEIFVAASKTAYDVTLKFQGAAAITGPVPAGAPTNVGFFQADIDTLTVGGGIPAVAARQATLANITYLTANATVLQGKFLADPFFRAGGGFLRLNGDPAGITVPEPGSMLLLSGLGLVAGRRVIARRRQQKAKAESETAA
ncbi:MAG: PEP-CTERM sorting domain-containing protein [Planctomycetaceae bacterium]